MTAYEFSLKFVVRISGIIDLCPVDFDEPESLLALDFQFFPNPKS